MTRQRHLIVVLSVVAVGLGIVGCDDDSSGGGGTTTDAPTGEPIKLMTIGDFEAFGLDYTHIPDAAQVAIDAVNADGGVQDRPLELVVCATEDENDANDCGRQAVQEGVTAVVGSYTGFSDQFLATLEEAGIPSVAPFAIGFGEYTSPISYPIVGGALSTTAGMGAQLADDGADRINASYLDFGESSLIADLVGLGATPRGAEIVSKTPVPGDTTDYSAVVTAAEDSDPDGIALVLDAVNVPNWVRTARQLRVEAAIATSTAGITEEQVETLGDAAEGLLVTSNYPPATFDSPEVDQFNDEVDEYNAEIVRDDTAMNAWTGVHLIADLLADAPAVDSKGLIDALNQGTIDVGIIPSFSFTEPIQNDLGITRLFNADVMYAVVDNGEIVAVDGAFVDPLKA